LATHQFLLNQGHNGFLIKTGQLEVLAGQIDNTSEELKDALLLSLRQRLQCCGLALDKLFEGGPYLPCPLEQLQPLADLANICDAAMLHDTNRVVSG
jgi:hypothetical protein